MGRTLTLLVLIGFCVGCAPVYTSDENARLVRDFPDELDYDSPPSMINAVRPEYPEIARRVGAEGMVRLKALILEDGNLAAVQIMEAANPVLADAAITALRRSTFVAAKKGGQPCSGTVVIPFVFGPDDEWGTTPKGLEEADHTGSHEEDRLVPIEPPSSIDENIRPEK